MKTTFALLLFFVSSAFAGESAEALVNRLIITPGEFDQMCDAPPPLDPKVPLPIYKLVADRDVHLSAANLELLRQRRAEVVPEILKRLEKYDFTKPPKPVKVERKYYQETGKGGAKTPEELVGEVETSGINPNELSGLLYEMILGLDAVETLPHLLRLEEQIRSLLQKADESPKSAAPSVALDGYVTFPSGNKALSKRDQAMSKGRVVQRELLSVMMQLLRAQKYQPLLETEFEKAYAEAIKKEAQTEDFKDIKTPEDAKAKNMEWVKFDPIYRIPVGYPREYPTVAFSAELRNAVRGFAEQFLKTVPKEEWKVTFVK